ncbi:aminotransferase class I/II-fold pyridoxal phosphate-dependent enzyme [Bacillus cytotoxicus]
MPLCFTNPGETILVPDPGYPDYLSGIALAKAKLETMPLLAENHFFTGLHENKRRYCQAGKINVFKLPKQSNWCDRFKGIL